MKKVIYFDRYLWKANFGCWLMSKERGVCVGDTRVINKVLFYAYSIYKRGKFRKPEVNWCPVDDVYNTTANMRDFICSF